MYERQQQDLDLWRQWRKNNRQKDLSALLTQLNPVIQKEVGKWGSTVPKAGLEARATILAVDALKQYDPNKGAAVATHVTSRIRKLSRHVYPYQNVARLPENKQLEYNTFQVANNRLLDNLGREPTVDELTDELGWSKKKVTASQQSFDRKEIVESVGAYMDDGQAQEPTVDFYYHGLAPTDRKLFEDITGYNNQKSMSNKGVMRKYNLTQGQVSYRKRKFVDDLRNIQQGRF